MFLKHIFDFHLNPQMALLLSAFYSEGNLNVTEKFNVHLKS